jgi:hypothetical protein
VPRKDSRRNWAGNQRATGITVVHPAGSKARFGEFVALRDRLDPAGVLGNAHLDRVRGSVSARTPGV